MLGTYLPGALYFTWLNVLAICTTFLHLFSPPIISFLSNPHKKIFFLKNQLFYFIFYYPQNQLFYFIFYYPH